MPIIYEFAIRKDILNGGKGILTPVCRRKKTIWGWISPNPWNRISLVEGKYTLLELDWIPELTYEECEKRVRGYQEELRKRVENDKVDEILHNLEEKTI